MTRKTKGNLLKCLALGVDVGAPLIATLTQFPAWTERSSGATVSGLFVLFALLSALPLLKQFGSMLKTPSVPVVWAIGCAALFCLRSIVDEMIIICAVGAISNAVGTVMYKYGESITGGDIENGKNR